MTSGFDGLLAEIAAVPVIRHLGRVTGVGRGTLSVTGLGMAAIGDRVAVLPTGRATIGGEVVQIEPGAVSVLLDGAPDGIGVGCEVELAGPGDIAPGNDWIGRIVDPFGRPLDGRPLTRGSVARPLRAAPPPATERRRLGTRLETGTAVFNTLLPLVRGQRIGLFAGSGVGKSMLLAKFARRVEADVVVIAMIGERGREVREFVEEVLGPEGMARSVIVTATSDLSPLVRRRAAWAAMAVAEHFRDQGQHVLLLADSLTRFAEAHREVALAGGESASLRGFPPSTAHLLMALAERAGPGPENAGDITAIFTVLVAGSDMDEPVADILRGVLDGHVVMDRAIAERGRFPAVDVVRSVSRSLPAAATPDENGVISGARQLLGAYDRAELMIRAGLYVAGTDPVTDHAIAAWPKLDAFLAEDEEDGAAASFRRLALAIAKPLAKRR